MNLLIRKILISIGENPDREGLKETPQRVEKMYEEIFRGYDKTQEPNITIFNNGVDGIEYDQMIMDQGDYYSHCEHHMVPFFGKYYFSYIPHPKGKVLGLSKVARVVDYYGARLQTQERLVKQIVDALWSALCIHTPENFKPLAMGLVMEGEHLCKSMRGVKKKGKMRTTYLLGTFKTDPPARQEFLGWVNKNV